MIYVDRLRPFMSYGCLPAYVYSNCLLADKRSEPRILSSTWRLRDVSSAIWFPGSDRDMRSLETWSLQASRPGSRTPSISILSSDIRAQYSDRWVGELGGQPSRAPQPYRRGGPLIQNFDSLGALGTGPEYGCPGCSRRAMPTIARTHGKCPLRYHPCRRGRS